MQLQVARQSVHDSLQLALLRNGQRLVIVAGCVRDFAATDAMSRPAEHDLELAALRHVERNARDQAREHGLAEREILIPLQEFSGTRVDKLENRVHQL